MLLLRSGSSFIIWLCLEINILAFLPVISSEPGISFENTIKYFIIQRCASIIFLLGIIFSLIIRNKFVLIKLVALVLKLGAAPFHGWFISILKRCSLWVLFLLSTLQKLLPLIIIVNITIYMWLLLFFSLFTFLVIFFSVPGAIRLNKILALSSIGNLIWLLISSQSSIKLILVFIFIYIILLLGVLYISDTMSSTSFPQIGGINNLPGVIFIFIFISLGRLPPLLGFLGKLIILKRVILIIGLPLFLLTVFTSLIILYTYISRFFYYIRFSPAIKVTTMYGKNKTSKVLFFASVFMFNLLIIIIL